MKKELTHRFGNPELISKSLINKLLELPALKDVNILSLRTFVGNLHNIVRIPESSGQHAVSHQQTTFHNFAERWSRRKLELQSKEVDLVGLDK